MQRYMPWDSGRWAVHTMAKMRDICKMANGKLALINYYYWRFTTTESTRLPTATSVIILACRQI